MDTVIFPVFSRKIFPTFPQMCGFKPMPCMSGDNLSTHKKKQPGFPLAKGGGIHRSNNKNAALRILKSTDAEVMKNLVDFLSQETCRLHPGHAHSCWRTLSASRGPTCNLWNAQQETPKNARSLLMKSKIGKGLGSVSSPKWKMWRT